MLQQPKSYILLPRKGLTKFQDYGYVDTQMDKRTLLVASWFSTTTVALILSIFSSIYLSTVTVVKPTSQNFRLYAALPESNVQATDSISLKDARGLIIEDFFKSHKSPLAEFGDLFIKVADENGLNWRLLPAIAMQESNGGKKVIKGSFNPFGYGIYGDKVKRFDSWEAAIERVGKALKEDYIGQGLKTPDQIMAKYTPPSLEKGGAWAKGVNQFIGELQ